MIDNFTGRVDGIVDIAVALTPYAPESSYYPGVRRIITAADAVADSYVTNESTALIVPAAGVLANDSDPRSRP